MFSRQTKSVFLLLIASVSALSAYSYFITKKTYLIEQELRREGRKYEIQLAEKLSTEESPSVMKRKMAAPEYVKDLSSLVKNQK